MAKPDKLYVIVDPDEGVLVLQLHNKGAKPRVTGTIKRAADAKALKASAVSAMTFVIEADGHANPALRTAVMKAFSGFKSRKPDGAMFAMGVRQGTALSVKGAKSMALKNRP
jgi:hypothetical protein